MLNRGDGTYGAAIQLRVPGFDADEALTSLTVGDFDGDEDTDVVTKAGSIGSGDRFIIMGNDGTARFPTSTEIVVSTQIGGAAWDVAAADFDGDEHLDLAWASHLFSSQAAAFLRNQGTGIPTFDMPEQAFFLGGFPRAVLPADLEGDGDLDLVVANQTDNNVAVLENLRIGRVARAVDRWGPAARIGGGSTASRTSAAVLACGEPGSGDCFEPHDAPGCEDEACCTLVCVSLPLCCLNQWDQRCVDIANDTCEPPPVCPAEGSCFEPHEESGCEDTACCELVCLIDGFCCGGPWDQRCVDEAAQLCGETACTLPECPPSATPEPETAECGDRTNDGCHVLEPAFTPLTCGEQVCATTWTIGNSRDTDWYTITVEEQAALSWAVTAEFPAEILIVEGTCDETFTVAAAAFGGGCRSSTTQLVVDPGTYMLFVAPGTVTAPIHDGIGCLNNDGEIVGGGAFGGRYTATVSCTFCPEDLNGDGRVAVNDFFDLLAAWGSNPGGPPDFNGDGTVGQGDLMILIAAWGPCF
jgi:hypothetical protein